MTINLEFKASFGIELLHMTAFRQVGNDEFVCFCNHFDMLFDDGRTSTSHENPFTLWEELVITWLDHF